MSNEIKWSRIENFVGYGRVDAPVVFIGPEEHLDSVEGLAPELRLRSEYKPIMDRFDALAPSNDERSLAEFVPTWKPMNDLMLRRGGCQSPTYDDRREYQLTSLGRRSGDTLLAELLPYPAPNRYDWVYGGLCRFSDRPSYKKELLDKRLALLKTAVFSHKRELIVCYGKGDWRSFESLFPSANWNDSDSAFRVADVLGTRVVLTRHFSRGFQTNAELANLARVTGFEQISP